MKTSAFVKMNSSKLYIYSLVSCMLPATRFYGLKRILLRWAGAVIGSDVRIVSSARFYIGGQLIIGDDTWIGHDFLLIGGDADVVIGSRVDIGPRTLICTGSHELFTTCGRAAGRGYSLPITVEDGVWIGAGSVILGGVTLGTCCMTAAGAVVNNNIEPHAVVGGVPARKINVVGSLE